MKRLRTNCKLCKRWIVDDWASRWRHILRVHPEIAAERLLPLIENPERARLLGRSVAERLAEKFL